MILVAGHLGNYDAIRGKLVREGHPIGSPYKPMKNPYFDREYVETISRIGFPCFRMMQMEWVDDQGAATWGNDCPDDGSGDEHRRKIPFMGRICNTPVSAAKMALKHNAVLIPCFAHRNEDGLHILV